MRQKKKNSLQAQAVALAVPLRARAEEGPEARSAFTQQAVRVLAQDANRPPPLHLTDVVHLTYDGRATPG